MFNLRITAPTYAELQVKISELNAFHNHSIRTTAVHWEGENAFGEKVKGTNIEEVLPKTDVEKYTEVINNLPAEAFKSVLEEVKPVDEIPDHVMAARTKVGKRGRRGPKAETIKIAEDLINEKVQEVLAPQGAGPAIPVFDVPPLPPEITKAPSAPIPASDLIVMAHTKESFRRNIVQIIAGLINTKKVTQEYVAALNEYFEVKQLWEVFEYPEKVTQLFDNFVKAGIITEVQA